MYQTWIGFPVVEWKSREKTACSRKVTYLIVPHEGQVTWWTQWIFWRFFSAFSFLWKPIPSNCLDGWYAKFKAVCKGLVFCYHCRINITKAELVKTMPKEWLGKHKREVQMNTAKLESSKDHRMMHSMNKLIQKSLFSFVWAHTCCYCTNWTPILHNLISVTYRSWQKSCLGLVNEISLI